MPQAAVLGHPVAHSLSPIMHRAAYAALGLTDWQYRAIDVDTDQLADLVDALDHSWAGLSVTMPLKREIRRFLVEASVLSQQVGAVNTVTVQPDPARPDDERAVVLRGYNTDVHGIVHALAAAQGSPRRDGEATLDAAVILGGGATAASALAAVREHGCLTPTVLVRSPQRAQELLGAAERLAMTVQLRTLDVDTMAEVTAALPLRAAVVSTLPAGAADALVPVLVDSLERRRRAGIEPPPLLDVVYNPWPTELARGWCTVTDRVAGGFEMLVHQAEGQLRLMTGQRPSVEVMRRAGQGELDRRTQSVH